MLHVLAGVGKALPFKGILLSTKTTYKKSQLHEYMQLAFVFKGVFRGLLRFFQQLNLPTQFSNFQFFSPERGA